MPAVLQYDFAIIGEGKVAQAFTRLERRATRHARVVSAQMRRAYNGAGVGTGAGTPRGSRVSAEAKAKVAAEREAGKTERARMVQVERAQVRQRQEQVAAERRAAAVRERAIKRESFEKQRAVKAEHREREKFSRKQGSEEKQRAREVASTQRQYQRSVRGKVDRAGAAVTGVAGRAATAIGLAGAGVIAAGLYQGVGLEQRQRQILINARGGGEQLAMAPDVLGAKIRATSIAHGQDQGNVTAGLEAFVAKTGDLDTVIASMDVLGTVATATGTSFEFIASSAADLMKKFDIKTPEQMAAAFTTLTMQGKKGAFELRNMAEHLPMMGAAAARFGLTGEKGVKQLGGMAQIAMDSSGSPEEAATAVARMFDALIEGSGGLRSGKLLGTKVETFNGGDPTKGMRDVVDIMADVMGAVGGDVTKFNKVFNIRAAKAGSKSFVESQKAYAAVMAGGGTKKEARAAAGAATMKVYRDAMEPGGKAGFDELQTDEAMALESTAAKLNIIQTKFTESVQTRLLPALTALIPKAEGLIEPFGNLVIGVAKAAAWFADNPFSGLGAIMAAAVLKDIAGAAIGNQLAATVTALITRSGARFAAGSTAAGAVGPGGTMAGASGVGGAAAMAVAATTLALYEVGELQKETGTGDLRRLVAGYDKNSNFSGVGLVRDLSLGPVALLAKSARLGYDVMTEESRKDENAKKDASWRDLRKRTAGHSAGMFGETGSFLGEDDKYARREKEMMAAETPREWVSAEDQGAAVLGRVANTAAGVGSAIGSMFGGAAKKESSPIAALNSIATLLGGTLNVNLTNPGDIKVGGPGAQALNTSDVPD